MKDVLDGKKEIYVDPQYSPQDLPPEYDEDEVPDYEIADEDMANKKLDDIGTTNYDNVQKILNQPEMTPQKSKAYLKNRRSGIKTQSIERLSVSCHKTVQKWSNI